ncbi:MAG: hypothetical protein ACKV2T_17075 [Kofleriaceae bacterium]
MKPILLGAALLGGCTHEFLDLMPARGATPTIGVGLEAVFDVAIRTCDPGDVYPAGCEFSWATLTNVEASGPVNITSAGGYRFRATDKGPGVGSVTVSTREELVDSYDIEVLPIRHSTITWMDRYFSYAPFNDSAPIDRLGPAFARTTIELSQDHYREPLAELARWPKHYRGDFILDGHAEYMLDGRTGAAIVPMPNWDAITSLTRFPRIALQTGDELGTAIVTTTAGGKLVVDVVDATAIASLGTYTGEPLDEYSYDRFYFTVVPRDANGRYIAGCPAEGPTVTDEKGVVRASRVETDREPFCVLRFDFAEGRALEPTTIVIAWNGAELRVPFDPIAD